MTQTGTYSFLLGRVDETHEFVAVSSNEPYFCFVCATEQEALDRASEALNQYVRLFVDPSVVHLPQPRAVDRPAVPARRIDAARNYEVATC